MCGISGVYLEDETRHVEESVLRNMCDTIRHRGPDDDGYFLDKNIGLGVRRLSVIDLVSGHQPIHNEDKTLWVVLNGEIYNFPELKAELMKRGHRFYTETDTEVIVHLYEEKEELSVNDLSGMFAFAILDTKKKSLFIARDRLGIKPLYYYNKNGTFIFSSELKAILDYPGFNGQIDPGSLYNFFSLNYTPAPATMFGDIKQLLAGHYLLVRQHDIKATRYWDVNFKSDKCLKEKEAIERLQYLLRMSVKKMLKSDVPLGAFLSGGVDSSALVSLIVESVGRNLKTFSVGFKEDSYDETHFANLVARHFGTEHYRTVCEPRDVIEVLPKIVWHADNLLADPAMLPLYLVSKLAKEHVTVCISGDGGDELFAGYPTYLADVYLPHYKKIPYFLRQTVLKRLIDSLPASSEKLSFEYKAKKFIEGAEFPPDKAHYWWRTVFSDKEKNLLFTDSLLEEVGILDTYSVYLQHYNNYTDGSRQALNKFMYADFKVWLTDNNLIRVDTMSMAHSLEVRVPFLDHELAEFAIALSPGLKMKHGRLKYLLKKAMKDILPPPVLQRKKAGWHIPLSIWFQSELKDYVSDVLTSSKFLKSGFFKKEYIVKLLWEHLHRKRNNSFKIWGLLVFSHWYDTFC